jgi:predicted O-methyltransferase YrrM
MSLVNRFKRQLLTYKELRTIKLFDAHLGYEEDTESKLNELKDEHLTYTSKISSPEMALSFELTRFIYRLSKAYRPKKVLDLGSGFSSFVLRKYAKDNLEVEVFSVDDDEEWLQKTKNYLTTHDLSTRNLFSLDEFIAEPRRGKFDLILLDLNFVEKRKNYLVFALQLLNEKGVLIFDDAHKVEYLREVKIATKNEAGTLFSVRKQTLDEFGRFSLVYKLSS